MGSGNYLPSGSPGGDRPAIQRYDTPVRADIKNRRTRPCASPWGRLPV